MARTDTPQEPAEGPLTLEEAMAVARPWVTRTVLNWANAEEYVDEAYEALVYIYGELNGDVSKPSVEVLAQVQQHLVDQTIEWARGAGHCDTAMRPLDELFGTRDLWLHSDGYDCVGYDANGLNAEGLDRYGFDRDGWRPAPDRDGVVRKYDRNGIDPEGYNRYGWDKDGYGRDGYNRQGFDRSGYNRYGRDTFGRSHDAGTAAQQIVSTLSDGVKKALIAELLKSTTTER